MKGIPTIENLLQWAGLGEDAEVRAWTAAALEDGACVVRLAKAATQLSRSHAAGDRVTRAWPVVHRPGLEKVLDVDRMIARLDAIAAAEPGAETLQVIRNFKRGLKGGFLFAHEDDEGNA